MITINYAINAMRSLSGARSVELISKHNDDDQRIQSPGWLRKATKELQVAEAI